MNSICCGTDKIEVQRSSISHLLSGRNKPSLDFVLKVLDNFKEVELYWLLNGKGEFPAKVTLSSSPTKADTPNLKNDNQQKEIDRIIIFYKDGKEVGRFVEYPRETMEADILKIVTQQPYKHSYDKSK